MDSQSIAYMNIAMIKYWCKDRFDPYLKPLVPSISLLSKSLYTITSITKSEKDLFFLNDELQDEKETKKIFDFVNKVVKNRENICIKSYNKMPTAAGLASSASAYAALTKELNRYFNLKLTKQDMAKISSMGSGSSARSFYNICAFTENGEIFEIDTKLELEMVVILISKQKKVISSREAMQICKDTSKCLSEWIQKNKEYYNNALKALKNNDFKTLGENMEKSTMLMHKTMIESTPSFTYLEEESKRVIEYIKSLRKKTLDIYFTTDAGPNVKVLFQKKDKEKILEILNKKYEGKIIQC